MLLLSGQGCGQPMQQMREGLMHGVCMWIPSRFAGRVYQSQPGRILWRKLTCLFVFMIFKLLLMVPLPTGLLFD